MAITNLTYPLQQGFIHNWLVAGPEITPIKKLSGFPPDQLELAIIQQHYTPEAGVTETPVDLGSLRADEGDKNTLAWRYYRCAEDHYVDLTAFYPTCNYLRAWAYAQILVPGDGEIDQINLVLHSNGPADVWVNGQHVQRSEHFNKQFPPGVRLPAILNRGSNEILVRFENAAIRETPFCLALQIVSPRRDEMTVVIPTDIESDQYEKRRQYETVLQKAYLDRYVYGWLTGDQYDLNESITVRFTEDLTLEKPLRITYRLQSLNEDIFQEGTAAADKETVYEMARLHPLRNGSHHLAIVPPLDLYYGKKLQFDRRELFHVVRTPYSQRLYGILKRRRQEALEDAAIRRGESVYSEIAKMALGRWDHIDHQIIQQTIERIHQRYAGSIVDLLGLIGALYRYHRKPELMVEFKQVMQACILDFRYWQDEPGEDVMDFQTESRQILFHTCQILAGQLGPNNKFTNTGQNGHWQRQKGEQLALAWLEQRATHGWGDWDSNTGYEEEAAALSYLVDLAASESVQSQAALVLDKLFFTLAINSYRGAFGSTHGRSDTASLLSSRLEPTSGISRLMWGMGNFNQSLVGTVSLALMKGYDFPNLLKAIAIRTPAAFWNREHHGAPFVGQVSKPDGIIGSVGQVSIPDGIIGSVGQVSIPDVNIGGNGKPPYGVDKVTYRTKDYMLCSAQDYRPGERGGTEHIWQATRGPDAIVFTNHPANSSLDDAHQPNFWRGNAVLPRVAQWGDVLIAQYILPSDDWMGFTHAYFPVKAFDETKIDGSWAFARQGKAYLALYSSSGLEFITRGTSAYRELRAHGKDTIWLCQMGQALLDESFEEFQQKIAVLDLTVEGSSIRVRTLRHDDLSFSSDGPLMINGQEQALTGFKHYENPYCVAEYPAKTMDIILEEQVMRLTLAE